MTAKERDIRTILLEWGVIDAVVVLAVVFVIQLDFGAYKREISGHSDEAAHFVSGVMVHDYLTSAVGTSPLSFAESYYTRYPKVAIGHWPPGFYILQSIWYIVTGVSKESATLLMGLIAATTAWCLSRRLSRDYGLSIALLTVVTFLTQPHVRVGSVRVMSDLLVALLSILAVFAMSDFLQNQSGRSAARFAIWSSLAILTKPIAFALAPFVPFAILFSGRFATFKNWRLWSAGAAVAVLTLPFYVWTWSQGMGLHSHRNIGQMVSSTVRTAGAWRRFQPLPTVWLDLASLLISVVAVIGCLSLFRRSDQKLDQNKRLDLVVATTWCVVSILFLCWSPIPVSHRYLLPTLTGMMVLYAGGLDFVHRLANGKRVAWTLITCVVVLTVVTGRGNLLRVTSGYAAAAQKLGSQTGRIALISSDTIGEGAFITERLLIDRQRLEAVLRASKVLAASSWSGGWYKNRFGTTKQLRQFMDSVPVHFIVIDDFAYRRDPPPPHHKLIKQMLSEAPGDFPLVGAFSVKQIGRAVQVGPADNVQIRIYENRAARGRPVTGYELKIRSRRGRRLKYSDK